jgi:hypothetical protein
MAHTRGPWTARLLHETERTYCTILARPGDIATIGSSRGMPADEIEANARLIAAAPELLSACQVLHARLFHEQGGQENSPWAAPLRLLAQVIAKAEGHTNEQ